MEKKKNLLVLTTWSYRDGLIQGATLPYLRIISNITGGNIYLVCWEQAKLRMTDTEFENERLRLSKSRIHLLRIKYRKNKLLAVLGWAIEILRLIVLMYRKRINSIHAFCMPAGGVGYMLRKFKRVRFSVDSMEPHADMMMETGVWSSDSAVYKISVGLEKRIAHATDYLIAVSKSILPYLHERYKLDPLPGKLRYRPLCIDPELFKRSTPDYSMIGWDKKKAGVIAIYTGKLGGMYFDAEFCTLIKACISYWKGDFHLIFCTSMDKAEVTDFLIENEVAARYFTVLFIQHARIPEYLSLADFGMSLSRLSNARQYGCPTKNAEYWSVGLPVLTTDAILDDSNDINRHPYLGVILPHDLSTLTIELQQLDALIRRNDTDRTQIRTFAVENRSYDIAKRVYQDIYG